MTRRELAAGCAPQLLTALDFAFVGVAVPSVQDGLGLSDDALPWLVGSYNVALGSLLLVAGRLADAYGRRRLLLAGLGLFALATVANAAAPTGASLLASRVVQGAGAALMTPAALSLLSTRSAPGEERRRVLGLYGVAISGGFVLGSLLAGIVAGAGSWRLVLALNLPLVLAAAVAAHGIPEDSHLRSGAAAARGGRSAGLRGAAAVSAGFGLVAVGVAGLGVAAVVAGALVLAGAWWRGGPRPGALRGSTAACLGGALVTGTGVSGVLLLTVELQDARGYSPLATGLAFAVFGLAAFPGARLARHTAARVGAVPALALGLAVQGAALAAAPVVPVLAAIAGFGLGHVIGNVAAALAAVGDAPPERHGALGGALATSQYVGGALVPAVLVGAAAFDAAMALAGAVAITAAVALALTRRPAPMRA